MKTQAIPIRRVPLILNSRAGSLYQSGFTRWLRQHREYFRIIRTESPDDARIQAEKLVCQCEPIVAISGGDGTLRNIARVLMDSDSALSIFPSGSMNVLARELGIGSHCYDAALSAMLGNARQEIDIFTVNGMPFLQLAGFGPDADIIRRITPKLKRRLGPASHMITAFQVLNTSLPRITMTTDGGEILCGEQIILGNGGCYGGDARLFRQALYDDGKVDAAIIQHKHIGILPEVLFSMLQQGACADMTPSGMEIRRLRRCVITAENTISYQLDGDYIGNLQRGEELIVEKAKSKLTICVPPSPEPNTPFMKLLTAPIVHSLLHKIAEIRATD